MRETDERYMQRCLALAAQGLGHAAPNPVVGAVLVHEDRIIGEGYHRQYGQAHAEVNCLDSVAAGDRALIPFSTMYVSLEPCAHFGKTPPCADRLVRERIPRVVIGCRDPFPEVDGRGMEKLLRAGIDVIPDVLRDACVHANRRFFTFHEKKRPYVILKWAETADGFIGSATGGRLIISNAPANRLVHRWRSEEAAILVGSGTVKTDNPRLTLRHWPGRQPVRLVVDRTLSLGDGFHVFDGTIPTLVFNRTRSEATGHTDWVRVGGDFIPGLLAECHARQIQSVLVEGGRQILDAFFASGQWDEARVVRNTGFAAGAGVAAPRLQDHELIAAETWGADQVTIYRRSQTVR